MDKESKSGPVGPILNETVKRSPKSLRHNVYKRCFKVYKRCLSQKLTLHILLEFKVLVNLGVNILKKKIFFC